MGIVIILAFLFLIAAVCLGVVPLFIGKHDPDAHTGAYDDNFNGRLIARAAGAAFAVIGVLVFIFTGINSVPVKNVGVVTSFGHVEGDLQPGFHWLLPWKDVTNLSETIQTTEFACNPKTGLAALDIRIGGQQTACLNITIQWQVKDSAAPSLFNLYDTSGNVQGEITNAVVVQELRQVVNQVMGDYNPIQDVASNSGAGNSQFTTFAGQILAQMRKDIGSQVDVRKIIMPNAVYDSSTQNRLNQIQQQFAAAAIAREQIQVNQLQATANNAIAKSVSNAPGVLVQECLNDTQDAIKAGYALPAGWNCLGSGSNLALSVK